MASALRALLALRHDPRIQRVPPFISLLLIIVGLAWLLVLPLDQYSRHTYVSENALLPGQVHTYFDGSEHAIFRAYRHETALLAEEPSSKVADKLEEMFDMHGLKTGRQTYDYTTAGKQAAGENVYAILQGPRADATEALVLVAAWRNMDGVLNQSGVALILTLARYFKRWSLWSKDIIFVITEDSTAGPQAWVDAYHDQHDRSIISDLSVKSGALQGAIAVDYPAGTQGWRYEKFLIHYDGINGQLPNLDLFNTVVHIASRYFGVGCAIQQNKKGGESYQSRLESIGHGILTQGLGHSTGPHASFVPYHVDAITLQTVGDGWHDEMTLGKVIESSLRSMNNLLEHLHQSFFFYLLIEPERFVSIATYLPSAMLIAVNFSVMSIFLWLQSGRSRTVPSVTKPDDIQKQLDAKVESETVTQNGMVAEVPKQMLDIQERQMLTPVMLLAGIHFLGLVPLYLFNNLSDDGLRTAFMSFYLVSGLLPYPLSILLSPILTPQVLELLTCFSLLILGISLATLSTLNFSLGLTIGLLASPLSFVDALKSSLKTRAPFTLLLYAVSPTSVITAAGFWWKGSAEGIWQLLREASFAWRVNGTLTAVIIWLLWWPAWFAGALVLASGAKAEAEQSRANEAVVAERKKQ